MELLSFEVRLPVLVSVLPPLKRQFVSFYPLIQFILYAKPTLSHSPPPPSLLLGYASHLLPPSSLAVSSVWNRVGYKFSLPGNFQILQENVKTGLSRIRILENFTTPSYVNFIIVLVNIHYTLYL